MTVSCIGRKSRFFIPPCIRRPRYGFAVGVLPLGVDKLEWRGYPTVKKFEDILAVSTEYRRVTDGLTDRQTYCNGIVRVMHSIAR